MSDDRLVVLGIGNRGAAYQGTRHNLGFVVCDRLAARWNCPFDTRKWQADLAERRPPVGEAGPRVLLVKPRTYVNCSGQVAQAVLGFYKLPPSRLLVVVDDLNLRLGDLRLRDQGSAGGHNGLRDIESRLGRHYPRLRLGIRNPERQAGADQVDFVLGPFAADEREDATAMCDKAVDCVEAWISGGIAQAMRFNGPLRPPPPKRQQRPAPAPANEPPID